MYFKTFYKAILKPRHVTLMGMCNEDIEFQLDVVEIDMESITFTSQCDIRSIRVVCAGSEFTPSGELIVIQEHGPDFKLYQFRFDSQFSSYAIFLSMIGKCSKAETNRILTHGLEFPCYQKARLLDDFLTSLLNGEFVHEDLINFLDHVCQKNGWQQLFVTEAGKGTYYSYSSETVHRNALEDICSIDGNVLGQIGILSSEKVSVKDFNEIKVLLSFALDNSIFFDVTTNVNGFKDSPRENVMIGQSEDMIKLRKEVVPHYSSTESVLIFGDRGVGKSLLAKVLSEESKLENKNIVELNCLFDPFLKEEIDEFLHNAHSINGSQIIILKHVEELSAERLKRVLELAKATNLFKIICTTSNHEFFNIWKNKFESIFDVPSLQNRKEDIPCIINYLCTQICEENNWISKQISDDFIYELQSYKWGRNIDELNFFLLKLLNRHKEASYIGLGTLKNSSSNDELLTVKKSA